MDLCTPMMFSSAIRNSPSLVNLSWPSKSDIAHLRIKTAHLSDNEGLFWELSVVLVCVGLSSIVLRLAEDPAERSGASASLLWLTGGVGSSASGREKGRRSGVIGGHRAARAALVGNDDPLKGTFGPHGSPRFSHEEHFCPLDQSRSLGEHLRQMENQLGPKHDVRACLHSATDLAFPQSTAVTLCSRSFRRRSTPSTRCRHIYISAKARGPGSIL